MHLCKAAGKATGWIVDLCQWEQISELNVIEICNTQVMEFLVAKEGMSIPPG
jgi:hypothetical protein